MGYGKRIAALCLSFVLALSGNTVSYASTDGIEAVSTIDDEVATGTDANVVIKTEDTEETFNEESESTESEGITIEGLDSELEEQLTEAEEMVYETVSCTTHKGTNEGYNNYITCASPIYSYLVECSSNKFMKLRANAEDGKLVVDYYDKSLNILSSKEVTLQLPRFGGFYSSGGYYYVVTGQSNSNSQDSVEVIRVTKYDSEWKALSSGHIYGFNTMNPFYGGSLNFTEYGNYIFVRSCHQMYSTHQANITFSFRKDTAAIVDSYGDTMNIGVGYASHSFNQFIGVDGTSLVAVDHGDAYPRSIVLVKYSKSITSGAFQSSCKNVTLMSIPGKTGDNTTGTSIGGFEISSGRYIVVGASMLKNNPSSVDNSSTRNIFIASCNKSMADVKTTWVTSYAADSGVNVSTPKLVKLATDSYILMWTEDSSIKYCKLDGSGNVTSGIYSMSGKLSDCNPIVMDGKITWFTWNNEKDAYYQISTSDLSNTKVTNITNGHNFENLGITSGKAQLKCKRCGETREEIVPTSYSNYWWSSESGKTSYSTRIATTLIVGQKLDLWVHSYTPDNANKEYKLTSSDESVVAVDGDYLIAVGPGTAVVAVQSVYNPSLSYKYTLTVKDPNMQIHVNDQLLAYTGYSSQNVSSAERAEKLEYSWYLYTDKSGWQMISDWKTNDSSVNATCRAYGSAMLLVKGRVKNYPNTEISSYVFVRSHGYISGTCQMPYAMQVPGASGYLIGLQTYDNPDNEYRYEMLVYDCNAGTWVYTTTPCKIEGNCMWTVWDPQYGYYWTLFRIYDKNGTLLDEVCYGFENI